MRRRAPRGRGQHRREMGDGEWMRIKGQQIAVGVSYARAPGGRSIIYAMDFVGILVRKTLLRWAASTVWSLVSNHRHEATRG